MGSYAETFNHFTPPLLEAEYRPISTHSSQPTIFPHPTLRMRVYVLALLLICLGLLADAAPRKKGGRRRVKERGRSMKDKKTRVWFQAESKEQCAQDPPEQIFTDVKPHTLCNEVNTTICICSTKDDPSKDSATWKFRCGECSFKWSVMENEEEADAAEDATNEIEDASEEKEKSKSPKDRKAKRKRIRNKQKNKKSKRRNN